MEYYIECVGNEESDRRQIGRSSVYTMIEFVHHTNPPHEVTLVTISPYIGDAPRGWTRQWLGKDEILEAYGKVLKEYDLKQLENYPLTCLTLQHHLLIP